MITIRPITEADTAMVLKWRNSESVKKYFIYQREITEADHMQWLNEKVKTRRVCQFIILVDSIPVGSVYLQDIDVVNHKAEFGIFIGEEKYLDRGIGTSATSLIVEYGFKVLNLHRIYLRVYETNKRAIASYEKAGFRREALLVDDVYVNGEYRNIVLMGLIKDR